MKRAAALLCVLVLTACSQKTAEQQIADAKRLVQEGEEIAAIVELKNAVVTEPNNAEARFQLGILEFRQGLWEEAEKELRRSLELGYNKLQAYPLLIKAIFYQNDFLRVLTELEDTPELNDTQVISTMALFEYLAKLKAGQQNPVIPTKRLQREDLLIAQAYQTLESGKPQVAKNITEQFISPETEPFEKLLLQGMIESLMGNHVEAIIANTKALEIFPTYHVARFLLAEQLIEDKQLNRADEEINKLLALNPNSGHANYLKSLVYFYQNEYEQAYNLANLALQHNAKPALASFIAGTSAYYTGRLESALRLLSTAATTLPPAHPVHRMLAQVKLELGYVDEVAGSLDDLNIEPGQGAEIYSLAALQKLQQGEAAESESLLNKAKSLDPNNPVGLLREGYILLDEGKDGAADSLAKALELAPDLSEAWILLAQAKYEEEGLASALTVADKWAELNELNGELLRGIIYLRDGDEKQAISHFTNLVKRDPNNAGALRYLMIGEARWDNFDKAIEYGEKLLDLTPNNLQNLVDVVNIKLAMGQEGELESFLKQRIAKFPESDAASSALALLYSRSQQPQKAINLLKGIVEPQSFGVYQALGDAYVSVKNFDKAIETYRDWSQKFPTDSRSWYRLIAAYQMVNDFDSALEATQSARRYLPKDDRLILVEAHLAASTGRFAQSKRAIDLLTEDSSELVNLTHTKGLLALNEKRFSDAVSLLSAYYETNPGFAVARLLAQAHAGLGEAEKGLEYLKSEASKEHDTLVFKLISADYASSYGMYDASIELYTQALSQKPDDFAALNNLASVYTQSGDLNKAEEFAKRVIEIAPDSPYALDTYGYVLLRQGKIPEGQAFVERALGKDPNNKEIQLHNVEALLLNGELTQAKSMLSRVRPATPLQQALYKELKRRLDEQK
ncbi:XrtA/PEP-CTERM system TPR-repeat protein PrsT [uncultured Alteromonas sp.]|uniref:XrtA/PEP-CTERM system TPR-repeat protein PrsT n=1 Tax=uncultured Alteromonas sp. TaxID=179113 RepID=UPI0025ECF3AD|nr:XrtA/PEP-CTERM system TPR-repeat protein PrsT [uncultured Alteromonas sp.]